MTAQHPLSSRVTRLKFTKLAAEFGVRSRTEWATQHDGKDYRLAKGATSQLWYLYVRNPNFCEENRPEWSLVRTVRGGYDVGRRVDDAKHNASIFLLFGQTPDHENWRD